MGIDLLRVISISLVLVSHYGLLGDSPLSGTHGVAIFFMVSGYCMYYSTHGRDAADFVLARFWRLIPTLVVCATITTLVEFALPEVRPDRLHTLKDYIANLACLPNGNILCDAFYLLRKGTTVSYNWVDGAYWSLLVEIRFYLLLYLLHYLIGIQRLAPLLAILGAFAIFNTHTSLLSLSQDFLVYLSFFSFGLACRAFLTKQSLAIMDVLLAVAVFLFVALLGSDGISFALNHENLASYAACFLIFSGVLAFYGKHQNKFISYLGVLSYPIYLLHQDIGLISIKLLEKQMAHVPAALLSALIIIALAASVQYFIVAVVPYIKRLCANSYFLRFAVPSDLRRPIDCGTEKS